MMGNNASQPKRVERAANPDKAREITSWLAEHQVKKSAKTGNPITLGRLAKAYAPALLLLRARLAPKIRLQFPTATPVDQADIAFLGYDNCRNCMQSRDYVEKFGVIITKVAFPSLSDSDIRIRNEGFARIAREGLERDSVMKNLLMSDANLGLEAVMKTLHVKPPASPLQGRVPPQPPASSTGGGKV
jgi:hypothetical protein